MKIIRLAFAFGIFLLASQAQAAVTLDNCEASPFALGGTGGTDNGFTVGAGSNQLLVLLVAQGAQASTTSATWNGVSLTAVTGATNTNATARTEILVLKAPTQGNQSLVISGAAYQFADSILCSFNGVDQTTPTQNGASNNTTSISITSATGDAVVATIVDFSTLTGTNQTTLYTSGANGTGANRASGAASVTMTGTGGGGSGSISGMDIKAAAGGASFAAPPCPWVICTR